jgi:hypothetical protein
MYREIEAFQHRHVAPPNTLYSDVRYADGPDHKLSMLESELTAKKIEIDELKQQVNFSLIFISIFVIQFLCMQ